MAVDQLAEKISATGLKVIKQSFACIFSNSIIYIYIYIYWHSVLFFIAISGHVVPFPYFVCA